MTNNIKIANAILALWPDLENYCKGLERHIYKEAMGSYANPNATMQIIDKIIELTARKDILQTLSHGLDSVIDGLPPLEREILRKIYFAKDTTAREMAAQMGIPLRSCYRRISGAAELFSARLGDMGINALTWEYLVRSNPWIKTVFESSSETV